MRARRERRRSASAPALSLPSLGVYTRESSTPIFSISSLRRLPRGTRARRWHLDTPTQQLHFFSLSLSSLSCLHRLPPVPVHVPELSFIPSLSLALALSCFHHESARVYTSLPLSLSVRMPMCVLNASASVVVLPARALSLHTYTCISLYILCTCMFIYISLYRI